MALEVQIDEDKLREEVVSQLVSRIRYDEDDRLADSIRSDVKQRVLELAEPHVAAAVDAAFADGFSQTNRYGEPRPGSSKITLRELLSMEAKTYLGGMVSARDGSTPYSSSSVDKITRLQWFVRKEVRASLDSKIGAAVKKAIGGLEVEIADQVRESVHKSLTRKR